MIKIENAVKTYGARTVLNVNEATFKEGRIYAVIGANGCGKSTLLQAISGTIKLNSGSIVKDREARSGSTIDNEKLDGENIGKDEKLDGENIGKDEKQNGENIVKDEKRNDENIVKDEKRNDEDIGKDRKLDICYMPQNSVGFAVSVKNNVEIAGKGLNRKLTKESAHTLLSDLGLWQLRRKNAAKLSGGETQRLSLARSLVVPHDVLLLDEPTAAMDVGSACVAEGIIKDYAKKHNCTLIFSSHSFGQVERLADEVLFMHEGEIVEIGEPSQLLHNPNTAEARAFVDFLKFDK